jgi:hypothetical protein
MSILFKEEKDGKIFLIRIEGKLVKADYERFVPEFDRLVKLNGKLRVLIDITNFLGWKDGSLWDEFKFDVKHFSDIERLAVVGDKKWEKVMTAFCQPFTLAEVRYFEVIDTEDAHKWLLKP